MYEVFNALTIIAKQHFRYDFCGSGFSTTLWIKTDQSGVGTFATIDAVDGGAKLTCGAVGANRSSVHMNNKRQLIHNSHTLISVFKLGEAVSGQTHVGTSNVTDVEGTPNDQIQVGMDTSVNASNFTIDSWDATTGSGLSSGVALDTVLHVHKYVSGASNIQYSIDGVLKVTKSTNLPTVKMQPVISVRTGEAVAHSITILSVEVFNS